MGFPKKNRTWMDLQKKNRTYGISKKTGHEISFKNFEPGPWLVKVSPRRRKLSLQCIQKSNIFFIQLNCQWLPVFVDATYIETFRNDADLVRDGPAQQNLSGGLFVLFRDFEQFRIGQKMRFIWHFLPTFRSRGSERTNQKRTACLQTSPKRKLGITNQFITRKR